MATKEIYKLYVGEPRPKDMMFGHLENGNSIIKGVAQPASNPIGGFAIFANRSQIWGRRLIKGEVQDRRVEPTNDQYTGELEFMEWGTQGGYPITIRYKNSCSSIDYDYQITQLLLPKFQEDLEDNYMQLPFGENQLYFDSEKTKIDFLRVHHENNDSLFKNPNSVGGMFQEVQLFDTTKETVKNVDEWFESTKLIKEANTFAKLSVLKTILAQKKDIKVDESNENSLYENLILYAKENGPEFMSSVNDYKRKVSEIIEWTKSHQAFDLTVNGTITVGQQKRDIWLTEVPAKGAEMLTWVFQNCLQPEVHEAINKLIHLSQKFK